MPRIVIAYDICDPKRLRRVHRAAQRLATPLQYSVFIVDWPAHRNIAQALQPMVEQIDPRYDDLRAYPLPSHGLIRRIGCATLPAGIHFSGLPLPMHEDFDNAFAGLGFSIPRICPEPNGNLLTEKDFCGPGARTIP